MPEIVPWVEDCVLLRAVARALALPLTVAATGLDFVHRCRRSGAPWTLSSRDLVCGCLYAAAKAEEAQMSTNQAINAVRLLELPENRPLLEALVPLARLLPQRGAGAANATRQPANAAAPGDPASVTQQSPVLVGDAYYSAKEDLFTAEQHVLRHLRWEVHAAHPYKHALHMVARLLGPAGCGNHPRNGHSGGFSHRDSHSGGGGGGADVWKGAGPVARVAVCLLHDALTATALGVDEPPEALAAAAAVAALQLVPPASNSGEEDSGGGGRWGDGGSPGDGNGLEEDTAAVVNRMVAAAGLDPAHVGRLAVGLLQLTAALAARRGTAGGGA